MKKTANNLRCDLQYRGNRLLSPATAQNTSSLSVSRLDNLGLPASSPHPPRPQSICCYRDLPKRFEETLARHRIQLTRKAFPLKERKLDFKPTEKPVKINQMDKDLESGSKCNYRLYNKPLLYLKNRHETAAFQKYGNKKLDTRQKSNTGKDEGKILPEIMKISLGKRVFLQRKKRVGAVDGPPPSPEHTAAINNEASGTRKNVRNCLIFYEKGSAVDCRWTVV